MTAFPVSENHAQERRELLEDFRRQLQAACGWEEPSLRLWGEDPRCQRDDEHGMTLGEALAWQMQVRHAAVYAPHPSEAAFTAVARFNGDAPPMPADSVLLRRLRTHSLLTREHLAVEDLAEPEVQALRQQLDTLGATVGAAWVIHDHVATVILVGPSRTGQAYAAVDLFRLSLYALASWRALIRHRPELAWGEPVPKLLFEAEKQERKYLEALWRARQPAKPLRLVILEEHPRLARVLVELFHPLGLELVGCRTQEEACAAIREHPPQVLHVDLSFNRKIPEEVLRCARAEAPQAVLIGTTTGYGEAREPAVAREYGFRCIVLKPMTPDEMTCVILEAALEQSVREARVSTS